MKPHTTRELIAELQTYNPDAKADNVLAEIFELPPPEAPKKQFMRAQHEIIVSLLDARHEYNMAVEKIIDKHLQTKRDYFGVDNGEDDEPVKKRKKKK